MQDGKIVTTENGEALEVQGIENSCVAQCAWFLDGHIRAMREHWQRKVDAVTKELDATKTKIDASLMLIDQYERDLKELREERDQLKKDAAIAKAFNKVSVAESNKAWNEIAQLKSSLEHSLANRD